MTRQRRIGLWMSLGGVLIGAVVGYALGGIEVAAAEALILGGVGLAAAFLAPEVLPPSPAALPRPAVGDSVTAVRRRRTEGFVVLFAGLPFLVACVLLAVAVGSGPWMWIAVAVTATYAIWTAYAFVLTSASGPWIDRVRMRKYARTVARLEADRELYRQRVDPAAEAAKGRRLIRWFLVFLAVQGIAGGLLALGLLLSVLL